ncbi:MAG: dihydroxyacetone kinase phosphoryl donor subunit DhaM [Desulfitobacteriaceae bacterium]
MVGVVIVSHSLKIAEGAKELASQMTPDRIPLAVAGGTKDGRLGTDAEQVRSAIESVYSDDGIVILYDLGSALMSTELAIEELPAIQQARVAVVHAPLVEGVVTAVVEISLNKNWESIIVTLQEMDFGKAP